MTRRKALAAAATLPLAVALPQAAPAQTGRQGPGAQGIARGLFQRFRLGGFEITALLTGQRPLDDPRATFGTNVEAAEFTAVSAANFLPADRAVNSFTPTLVNTGNELVLFDTGLSPDGITAALAQAGVAPEAVDLVVLTHMHGDHIGGLLGADGAPLFPNAAYAAGRIEFDHWAKAGNEGFETRVRPLAPKMTFLEDGRAPAPGMTAMAAFGHTPGHLAFLLESEGQRLMLTGDTANHYVWSLQHPDWEVRFDADKPAAAATRRRIFGMIASERLPFIGYHMPFPGLGYVEAMGDGFRYVAHGNQLTAAG